MAFLNDYVDCSINLITNELLQLKQSASFMPEVKSNKFCIS